MKDSDSINRAYRANDIKRWQSQEFTIGYEICRSNNPDNSCEICGRLEGKYPKNFAWSGWHNKCKCFVIPVLQDYEEMRENRRSRFHAALYGKEYTQVESKEMIRVLPRQFMEWYKQNVQQMNESESHPDFIIYNSELIKASSYIY